MNYRYTDEKKKHLHSLDGKPLIGTSSVLSVIAKPLTWWASGMAVAKFGWLDPKKNPPDAVKRALDDGYNRVQALTLDGYETLLKDAYKAHSVKLDESAKGGTDMHAEIEEYVKRCIEHDGIPQQRADGHKAVIVFASWAVQNVKKFLWSEAHCFSSEYWLGGISDCGVELNDGRVGIIDFKSSKEAYLSQFWQCAGYDIELSENGGYDADGNILFKLSQPIDFYCVLPFGADNPEPVFDFNVTQSKEAFLAALQLYKIMNNTAIDK